MTITQIRDSIFNIYIIKTKYILKLYFKTDMQYIQICLSMCPFSTKYHFLQILHSEELKEQYIQVDY
jgi:hypothetical protein